MKNYTSTWTTIASAGWIVKPQLWFEGGSQNVYFILQPQATPAILLGQYEDVRKLLEQFINEVDKGFKEEKK